MLALLPCSWSPALLPVCTLSHPLRGGKCHQVRSFGRENSPWHLLAGSTRCQRTPRKQRARSASPGRPCPQSPRWGGTRRGVEGHAGGLVGARRRRLRLLSCPAAVHAACPAKGDAPVAGLRATSAGQAGFGGGVNHSAQEAACIGAPATTPLTARLDSRRIPKEFTEHERHTFLEDSPGAARAGLLTKQPLPACQGEPEAPGPAPQGPV